MNSKHEKRNQRIGLKIVSVILAVLLWFYVVNQGELTARQNAIEVELKYYNLAEGLSVKAVDTVTVRLWGTFQETGDVMAYIDLSGLGPGSYELPISVEPVKGAMFTSVEPNRVQVILQEVREQIVKINYEITESPPPGYEVLDVITLPDKCLIKGEEKVINSVATVVCPLNLSNATDIVSYRENLQARDSRGNLISDGLRMIPDNVEAYAVVKQKKSSKEVKIVPVISNYPGEAYQVLVTIEPESVNVLGNDVQVQAINEIKTQEIDLSNQIESFSREIDLELPQEISVYPSRVLVNVEINKSENEVE